MLFIKKYIYTITNTIYGRLPRNTFFAHNAVIFVKHWPTSKTTFFWMKKKTFFFFWQQWSWYKLDCKNYNTLQSGKAKKQKNKYIHIIYIPRHTQHSSHLCHTCIFCLSTFIILIKPSNHQLINSSYRWRCRTVFFSKASWFVATRRNAIARY